MKAAPRSIRIALLGAVAIGMFGGAALNYTFLPRVAHAQTTDAQTSATSGR